MKKKVIGLNCRICKTNLERFLKYSVVLYLFLCLSVQVYSSGNDIKEYMVKANKYYNQSNFDSCLYYYDKALGIAKNLDDEMLAAHILRLKGFTFSKVSNYDSASFYLQQSQNLAREIENDTVLAYAYLNHGWIMQVTGDSDSAFSYYHQALDVFERLGDSIGIAKTNINLAIFYKYSGDFEKCLEAALNAYFILKKTGNTRLYVNSLIHLGNSYEKLKENDTAISCYNMAYQLSVDHQFNEFANTALTNIAVIHFNYGLELKQNDKDEQAKYEFRLAEKNFLKAIYFNEKIGNKKEQALLYSNISIIYRRLDSVDKAVEVLHKSLEIAREINDIGIQIRAYNNLGLCYKTLEKFKKAEESYLESLALSKKTKQKDEQESVMSNLSNIYELMGDYKTALYYNREAALLSDSILNEAKLKEIEKHKINYEILHLKDMNRIKELDKKRIRAERNVTFWSAIFTVVLLIWLVVFLRIRARKNRIIAAQKIQKLEDEKKLMAARAVLVGQEKERERIARELHDGIGVLLSTASIHFSSVEGKVDNKTGELLKKANKLLKKAGQEVRQISHNMMPGVLSKFGLREAIEDLFEDVQESGTIEVDLNIVCPDDKRLPENMEIMIYRIVQEMLNNTLKYANASLVKFHISKSDELIEMVFSDNGVGFEEDKLPNEKNLGLSGIRSRVEYLGGKVILRSEPGKGTEYLITIPLSERFKR